VVAELLGQHAAIRAIIGCCERLADQLERGATTPLTLTHEVGRLRVAFDAHNRCEEHFLRPLLADSGAFAEVRLDHMFHDHVEEHRLVGSELASDIIDDLRMTLARLRDHLATEERYFLTAQALRDDVVVVESGG
jgi:hypothetical protein